MNLHKTLRFLLILTFGVTFMSCHTSRRYQLETIARNNTIINIQSFATAHPFIEEIEEIVPPADLAASAEHIDNITPSLKIIDAEIIRYSEVTRQEKREMQKEVKAKLRSMPPGKINTAKPDNDILYAILSVVLPPLAVYLYENRTLTTNFWVDLVLTLFFWVPGIVFALLVVFDVVSID